MFHIGVIRRRYVITPGVVLRSGTHSSLFRWLTNPRMDLTAIPPVSLSHVAHERSVTIPGHQISNPLAAPSATVRPDHLLPTTTISSQEVHHRLQSMLKSTARGIQTVEQMERLERDIAAVE